MVPKALACVFGPNRSYVVGSAERLSNEQHDNRAGLSEDFA